MKANDRQVGGNHYDSEYQHWDWAIDVGLGPIEYAATKYVARWKKKDGAQALEKARHYVQKIREAHNEGRYSEAIERIPVRIAELAKNTVQFARSNDLGHREYEVCLTLAMWSNSDQLNEVNEILEELIRSAQTPQGQGQPAVVYTTPAGAADATPRTLRGGSNVRRCAACGGMGRHYVSGSLEKVACNAPGCFKGWVEVTDGMEHPFGYDAAQEE